MYTSSTHSVLSEKTAMAREAALEYWARFGWPVRVSGDGLYLTVAEGTLGLRVSAVFGAQLRMALNAAGENGVVFEHADAGRDRWVFLVDGDKMAGVAQYLPQVEFALPGSDIALPPSRSVTWIDRPTEGAATHFSIQTIERVAEQCSATAWRLRPGPMW